MTAYPSKAVIQKLIASHPDGVRGEPLAMGWSTRHPGTLVIIDRVGHKLIFSNAEPVEAPDTSLQSPQGRGEARLAQSGSPNEAGRVGAAQRNPPTPNKAQEIQAKPPNKARTRAGSTPNKASENRPVTHNEAGENQLRSTNKPQTSGEKTTNKPVTGRVGTAQRNPPASSNKPEPVGARPASPAKGKGKS